MLQLANVANVFKDRKLRNTVQIREQQRDNVSFQMIKSPNEQYITCNVKNVIFTRITYQLNNCLKYRQFTCVSHSQIASLNARQFECLPVQAAVAYVII